MAYFFSRAKHSKSGTWDKGMEVKDAGQTEKENYDAALQAYHAYLGAYAYGHDATIDCVTAHIIDENGNRPLWEVWDGRVTEEPEE